VKKDNYKRLQGLFLMEFAIKISYSYAIFPGTEIRWSAKDISNGSLPLLMSLFQNLSPNSKNLVKILGLALVHPFTKRSSWKERYKPQKIYLTNQSYTTKWNQNSKEIYIVNFKKEKRLVAQ